MIHFTWMRTGPEKLKQGTPERGTNRALARRDFLKISGALASAPSLSAFAELPAGERRFRRTRLVTPGFAPPAEGVAEFEERADSERV